VLAEMDDAWSGKCSRGSEQRAIEARQRVCAAFVPGTTAEAGRAPLVLASAGGARCRKAGSWQGTSWASARASASG
jgi:hypothetical protein